MLGQMLLLLSDELFSLGGVEEEARSVFVRLSQPLRLGRFCLQTLGISKKKILKKLFMSQASFELRSLSMKKLSLTACTGFFQVRLLRKKQICLL